jgi:hypothetical protein
LMSSAAGSRARTSHSLEDALASKVRDLVSGRNTPGSLANYDPATSSWRTSQACLVSGWEPFSETWPRSGTMRRGIVSPLRPSAPLTDEIGSGLLPTPEASNTKAVAMRSGGREPRNFLLPTPRASDGDRGGRGELLHWCKTGTPRGPMLPTPSATSYGSNQGGSAGRVGPVRHSLDSMARHNLWPTPNAGEAKQSGFTARRAERRLEKPHLQVTLTERVGGSLNPTWVEWLQGFPLGWTEVD